MILQSFPQLVTRLVVSAIFIIGVSGPIHAQQPVPDIIGNVAWSPDGNELTIISNNGLFIYSHDFNLLRHSDRDVENYLAFGGWNVDGTKIILGNQIIDNATLNVVAEFPVYLSGWINSGSQVFSTRAVRVDNTGGYQTAFEIRSAIDGSVVREIAFPFQIEEAVSSPDGTKISTSIGYIVDLASGDQIRQVNYGSYYTWSPDSSQIASVVSVPSGSNTGNLARVEILDVSTGSILRQSQSFEGVRSLSWSRYAPYLVGVSDLGTIYLWSTQTLDLLNVIQTNRTITELDISPFAGTIAVGLLSGSLPSSLNSGATLPGVKTGVIELELNDTLALVTPLPSIQYIQSIAIACNASPGLLNQLTDSSQIGEAFTQELESLTDSQIPPACRADLLAVAAALQASP